jgi:probable F420-dependent oxidoreductase
MTMTDIVPQQPFRFGLNCWEAGRAAEWRDFVREAEDLGYSTVLVPDHAVIQEIAPLPALAVAAAVTERLRVGTYVLCNDFRNPALLAKELATIDVLSEGRLEIGIGAGWAEADYRFLHQPFDSGRQRVERLAEAVAVLKQYFAGGAVDHAGAHYEVGWGGLPAMPAPVQRPHPPLLIGGGGPKLLSLAAREADIVALNAMKRRANRMESAPAQNLSEADAAAQLGIIREAAGERMTELELNANVMAAIVTNDSTGAAMGLAPGLRGVVEDAASETRALIGTETQIIETCLRRRETLGLNYITLPYTAMRAFAPVVAALAGK